MEALGAGLRFVALSGGPVEFRHFDAEGGVCDAAT